MNELHSEIVTKEGVLRGMIHLPEGKKSLGTMVIFHGYFASNRVGPARLYVELARELAKCGFAIIRFDCLGVGDSDGEFCNVSLESEIRDCLHICEFALKYNNTLALSIIGHSMGANLALHVSTKFKKIKELILIAPEIEALGGIDRLFDTKQLNELTHKGWTVRKGLSINASFINAIRSKDVITLSKGVTFPCFIFQGDNDELYSLDGAKLLASSIKKSEIILIRGADHNFLNPDSRVLLYEHIKNMLLGLNV